MANILSSEKRAQILGLLSEGMSQRAICRVTGVARQTVNDFLIDMGTACADYQDRVLRDLPSERLELDEQWAFVGCKHKNVPEHRRTEFGIGNSWLWVALDADTKLVVTWLVGNRDIECAKAFCHDLASRIDGRVQVTSDGWRPYLDAVSDAFGRRVDFAQLVKQYAHSGDASDPTRRYSPSECTGAEKVVITGNPDPDFISTSYVERFNLENRMHNRRFTRLTNAFSKSVVNHAHSVAIGIMVYNFCRIHGSLRVTPAMAANVTDHPWEYSEVVALLDAQPKQLAA